MMGCSRPLELVLWMRTDAGAAGWQGCDSGRSKLGFVRQVKREGTGSRKWKELVRELKCLPWGPSKMLGGG